MSLLDDITKFLGNMQEQNRRAMRPGESNFEQTQGQDNLQAVRDQTNGPQAKAKAVPGSRQSVSEALIDHQINKTTPMEIDNQTLKLVEQYNKKNQSAAGDRYNLVNPDTSEQVQKSIDAYRQRLGEQGLEIPPVQYNQWDGKPLPPPKYKTKK